MTLLWRMYPDVVGGAELFIHRLSNELVKKNNEVHIIAEAGPKFITMSHGGLFHHAYKAFNMPGFRFVFNLLQIFLTLLRIRPDLCLCTTFEPAIACWAYSKIFGASCIIRLAGHDFKIIQSVEENKKVKIRGLSLLRRKVYVLIFNFVKSDVTFIVLNKEMLTGLLGLGVKKTSVSLIYNFTDDRLFNITANAEVPTVLFCGRIEPQKKVDTLVKAFFYVLKHIPDAKLIIVGDGSQRVEVEKLIAITNLSHNVELHGFVPYESVKNYLSRATLFVLASEYEGTPNALLQAMAAGLPIVSTKVGGIPDLINSGHNGLLVPPNNCELLANAMVLLLSNKNMAKTFAMNARTSASNFKTDNIVKQYVDLFESLFSKKCGVIVKNI